MSIYEVQIVSDGRWIARDVFEDLDTAHEFAGRIERMHRPDQLRIRRVDLIKPGVTRERTMYDGGRTARRDNQTEQKRQDRDAYRQRIANRRIHRDAEKRARVKKPLFSSTSPVYLTLVFLSIGLTGLSAMYLVERAFIS